MIIGEISMSNLFCRVLLLGVFVLVTYENHGMHKNRSSHKSSWKAIIVRDNNATKHTYALDERGQLENKFEKQASRNIKKLVSELEAEAKEIRKSFRPPVLPEFICPQTAEQTQTKTSQIPFVSQAETQIPFTNQAETQQQDDNTDFVFNIENFPSTYEDDLFNPYFCDFHNYDWDSDNSNFEY